jgi:RNA polymerase sigma-70 factor (ECF subfamily)
MQVMDALFDHDTSLMLRAKAGHLQDFEELLARHRKRLIHWLYRVVQDRAVAEELAQEVFLRVYLSRETYEPSAKFTTWLYRIANNRALNWLRDHGAEQKQQSLEETDLRGIKRQIADEGSNVAAWLLEQEAENEFQRSVRRAVAALPPRQRTAVLMHKFEGLDYAQIADSMGCPVSTVKSVLWRAYETLRIRLAPVAERGGWIC